MNIYFVLARRVPPVLSPVLREVFADLTRRGFGVESGIAEETERLSDGLLPATRHAPPV